MTPGEIDAYVREQAAAGADLYHLHEDALSGLDPDLILTQDLCWVCALPSGKVTEALDFLGCTAEVLALDPYSFEDVLQTIAAVAVRAGVAGRGTAVVAELRARLARVAAGVAGRSRPRVAVVEWVDPPFTAGHWIPDLVEAAGGEPVGGTPGERSVPTTWAAIAQASPDVVVVSPCGFHLDGAAQQAQVVLAQLPDVPVWAIDGDGLIVRPGPRLVAGVEALAAILHPDAVPPAPQAVRRILRG
jgi:iron complex transport system substrate-binding protein